MAGQAQLFVQGEFMATSRKWVGKITIACAALASLAVLSASARAEDTGPATFKAKCALCHGPDGKGDTQVGKSLKIPDLGSADVQKESDAELTTVITNGKKQMPAFGKSLKSDQIMDLVVFIRSLAKKSAQRYAPQHGL
jgi:mono/diheme cytochrome c family protein